MGISDWLIMILVTFGISYSGDRRIKEMIKFRKCKCNNTREKNSVRRESGDTGWRVCIDMWGKWMWKNHNDKTD